MEGKQKGCTFGKRGEYTFHQYETHKPSSNLEAEGIIWAFGSSLLQRLGDWQAHCSCIPLVHKVPFNVGATLRLAHKKCFCCPCYSNCPPTTSLRPISTPQNWNTPFYSPRSKSCVLFKIHNRGPYHLGMKLCFELASDIVWHWTPVTPSPNVYTQISLRKIHKCRFGRPTCLRLNKQTKSSFPSLDTWESCIVRFGDSHEYHRSIYLSSW